MTAITWMKIWCKPSVRSKITGLFEFVVRKEEQAVLGSCLEAPGQVRQIPRNTTNMEKKGGGAQGREDEAEKSRGAHMTAGVRYALSRRK